MITMGKPVQVLGQTPMYIYKIENRKWQPKRRREMWMWVAAICALLAATWMSY